MSIRVLLIEDESGIGEMIVKALLKNGILCDKVSLGQQGINVASICEYSVILLDLMLPDINGFEVLMKLRAIKVKSPIIILSGLSSIDHITKGLKLGADDYMSKPVNIEELVARIHAVIRRSKSTGNAVVQIDDSLVINFDRKKMIGKDDKEVSLTDKELAVLDLLISRRGTVVEKSAIMDRIYGGPFGKESSASNPKNVDVFICKIREKIAGLLGQETYIETVWSRGYRLKERDTSSATKTQVIDASQANAQAHNYQNVAAIKTGEIPGIVATNDKIIN